MSGAHRRLNAVGIAASAPRVQCSSSGALSHSLPSSSHASTPGLSNRSPAYPGTRRPQRGVRGAHPARAWRGYYGGRSHMVGRVT